MVELSATTVGEVVSVEVVVVGSSETFSEEAQPAKIAEEARTSAASKVCFVFMIIFSS